MSIWVQVMLCARPSSAVHFVNPSNACLEHAYGDECGRGTRAAREPLLIIRPDGFRGAVIFSAAVSRETYHQVGTET
jgi:hypothetical protein